MGRHGLRAAFRVYAATRGLGLELGAAQLLAVPQLNVRGLMITRHRTAETQRYGTYGSQVIAQLSATSGDRRSQDIANAEHEACDAGVRETDGNRCEQLG